MVRAEEFQLRWADSQPLWRTHANIMYVMARKDIVWNRLDCIMLHISGRLASAYLPASETEASIARGRVYLENFDVERKWASMESLLLQYAEFADAARACDYASMGADDLRDHFLRAVNVYGLLCSEYRSTGDEETRLFGEELRRHLDLEEIQRLDASLPEHFIDDERVRFSELLTRQGRDGVNAAELLAHVADFPWLAYNLHTPDAVVQFMRDRAGTSSESPGTVGGTEQPAAAPANLPASLRDTFTVIKAFRTRLKLARASLDFVMIPCFTEVCRRTGVDMESLMSHYDVDDIVRLLEAGDPIPELELAARRQSQLLLCDGEILHRFSGPEAEATLKKLVFKPDQRELSGTVACSAPQRFVSGQAIVLVCDDPESLRSARERVSPGHIIVTSMAQFNALDVVVRAAGLVTDEGGVLCHAAIVAREFGIPCIVGTRTGRTVIEDGAMLTMDLTLGTIRVF